jgi:hypothetical protein
MDLIRYVMPHLLAGCGGGAVASGLVVGTNLGSLRDLIMHTDGGWMAVALMTFGFMVTFGSAAIGHAIIRLGDDHD